MIKVKRILTYGLVMATLVSCSQQAGQTVSEESVLSYLESEIAPCTLLEESSRDPCVSRAVPRVEDTGAAAVTRDFSRGVPKYWELYYDEYSSNFPLNMPHLVIRATFLPNTTRCALYPLKPPNYAKDVNIIKGLHYLYCFVDVRVNDYLLGTGPSELTVVPTYFSIGGSDPPDDEVNSRGGRVMRTYEGVEAVLFLTPSVTTAAEAWWVSELWDVQERSGATHVVSENLQYIRFYGDTPENRAKLIVPLADFEESIAKAAVVRAARHEGRTGANPDLPMLVTDANLLRPYFEQVGVAYETDAPAKPPPVPGEEDPEQPPVTTGEEDDGSSGSVPVPGGDEQPDGGGGGTGP